MVGSPETRSYARQPDWVDRLYAKFPVQSGSVEPVFGGRVEATRSSPYGGEAAR